jgi:hypothetical protein
MKYSPAPATARKMPKILAEFSPKFTIAALLSQSYGSEFSFNKASNLSLALPLEE